jgi:hypothetical protein
VGGGRRPRRRGCAGRGGEFRGGGGGRGGGEFWGGGGERRGGGEGRRGRNPFPAVPVQVPVLIPAGPSPIPAGPVLIPAGPGPVPVNSDPSFSIQAFDLRGNGCPAPNSARAFLQSNPGGLQTVQVLFDSGNGPFFDVRGLGNVTNSCTARIQLRLAPFNGGAANLQLVQFVEGVQFFNPGNDGQLTVRSQARLNGVIGPVQVFGLSSSAQAVPAPAIPENLASGVVGPVQASGGSNSFQAVSENLVSTPNLGCKRAGMWRCWRRLISHIKASGTMTSCACKRLLSSSW